jgi:hypothetical protein
MAATTNTINNNLNVQINTYDDTGSFDENNISQHRLCTSQYMHVTPHNYILCLPHIPYSVTKMDVARAVENQILTSGKRASSEIINFEYVTNVTFIRAFDQAMFNSLTTSRALGSSSFGFGSGSKECYRDPWYKIAFVNITIPPCYSENGFQFYTNGEDAFYNGVCSGDIVINSWTDAFFVAHPRTYFQNSQEQTYKQQQQQQSQTQTDKREETENQCNAFQRWKCEFKVKQLERKVKEYENTIRQYELDAIRTQNMVNEYAESMRFLTRQQMYFPELDGLHSSGIDIVSYLPALNNRYARVCVSDTTFLEANRNMKLKQLNGHVITACDDCDACQELIHSIDHTQSEERDEVFASIERMICRVNKGIQKFEKLHVNAERSLFGLRNRRVFEDFAAYLTTALEIMEEVTSRVSTFTQELEYARCYGRLFREHHSSFTLGYNYDYAENVDQVYDEHDNDYYNDDTTGIESTQQMLNYFDEQNEKRYKESQQQQEEQQQRQEEQQQQQEEQSSSVMILKTGTAYHEEAVIIEGEEDVTNVTNGIETTMTTPTTTTPTATLTQNKEETQQQQKKKSGWMYSWF